MTEKIKTTALALLLFLNVVCGASYFAKTWHVDTIMVQQSAMLQQCGAQVQQYQQAITQHNAVAHPAQPTE